jgi:14-3-3 protein epsilon
MTFISIALDWLPPPRDAVGPEETMAQFEIPTDRRGLIVMAKVAEQCERYDEMLVCLKRLISTEPVGVLSLEEKNLLSVAYKNVVGGRRAPWRTLQSFEQKNKNDAFTAFKGRMETEIAEICGDIFSLLTDKLIPNSPDDESRVFYYKLKADYHRYYVEVLDASGSVAAEQRTQARGAYESAIKYAASLNVESPNVLGLKLNFSVFQYEIEKEQHAGYDLAKATFNEAYERLDALEDDDYRESATIMSLLRDNLHTWAEALNIKEEGAEADMAVEDC